MNCFCFVSLSFHSWQLVAFVIICTCSLALKVGVVIESLRSRVRIATCDGNGVPVLPVPALTSKCELASWWPKLIINRAEYDYSGHYVHTILVQLFIARCSVQFSLANYALQGAHDNWPSSGRISKAFSRQFENKNILLNTVKTETFWKVFFIVVWTVI